jgi:hypothetical protein
VEVKDSFSLFLSLFFTALRERFLRAFLLTSFFPKRSWCAFQFWASLGLQAAFEGLFLLLIAQRKRENKRALISLSLLFSRRTHRETTEGTQQEKSAQRGHFWR